MKKPHSQGVIALILFLIFLFVSVGLAAALSVVFAPVKLTLNEDAYTLSFLWHKEGASYAEVTEVALLDENYSSDRIKSYGGISKQFGTYKNDAYGEHFRLTFSENTYNFILIKRADGSVSVFNQKTKDATVTLYEKLLEKINDH